MSQTDRQTGRQAGKQAGRQANRQTDNTFTAAGPRDKMWALS